MPRDLPGLYWDEDRKRYFPLSARPAAQSQAGPSNLGRSGASRTPSAQASATGQSLQSSGTGTHTPPRKRRRLELLPGGTLGRGLVGQGLRSSINYAQARAHMDKVMTHSLSTLSEGKPFCHGDFMFSSMDVSVAADGSFVASTGDKGGWLQTYTTDKRGYPYGGSRELYLGSDVTAVCRSDTHRLAVSFGPSSKIAVENIAEDAEIWNIISIGDHRCHDVQTAHLYGKSLVLGAARRGILLSDIQAGWSFDVLPTGSDVLSVFQTEHLIYTGSRNGAIQCFDKRLQSRQKGAELFGGRYRAGTRSITHLAPVRAGELLVGTIKGDLELLDLRFARHTTPLVQYAGHVNAYSTRLGIAVSPDASLLFAAGQDNRVRAWALRSGEPLLAPPPGAGAHPEHPGLLSHAFGDAVTALCVTEGGGGGGAGAGGTTLWAAAGKEIHRFWLGQRLGEGVLGY
ncbi:WD40 repeat-like protein [Phanerochaete sordida]|uniref:WD40 repeat-like protein n=1 Tax=Phanerochaete sordida TaxID=48140 RepID=A0A9P3G6K8_9APHY|nr:WD40 repeat-like protein [Phanerochaete sordida]